MLASLEIDRWKPGFGASRVVREKFDAYKAAKLAAITDSRDKQVVETAFDEFRAGKNLAGAGWKPGFDTIFPPQSADDDLLEIARKKAIDTAVGNQHGALLGAGVFDSQGTALVGQGSMVAPKQGSRPAAALGSTSVYRVSLEGGRTGCLYVHPMRNLKGAPEGEARVLLDASGAKPPSPLASAGFAALGAFVGAFVLALLMSLGPVRAMRRLAQDAEALARGDWSVRVTVAGPDVVQAAAKNVQKLGSVAAAGAAAAAVPQVVQQQVVLLPVQEVQEGLAPFKAFRRPDEFEVEATQKVCPDLGNDFHDAINVDDEHVGLLVADVPNLRGVRGAMYMAQVRALFRAAAPGQTSPAEVLKAVNRVFAQDLPRGIYVTAVYCVVSRTTGVCKVANAQHLPLVFWKLSKKASAKLQTEGIALGLDPGPVFEKTIAEKSIQLDRGDRIVLTTDGAITAKNAAGAQYGDERFYYVINREAPKNSAAMVNLVANDMDLFHEGAPQLDDLTIVTLRRVK
jgi:serine phosphatase RsbU (regulator of sigma subunit)